jgi:integrase
MSVYRPATSRFFQYDFQYKGKRYTGSTGVETKRKAEEVERKVRADVALGLYDDQAGMTLDHAAGKWWDEVGQHLATATDVERRLEIVSRLLGKDTRLVDISTRKIAAAIEVRRGETFTKTQDRPARDGKPAKPAKRYPVSNGTVNADIVGILRRIMRRAGKLWEVKPLADIDWQGLTLPEPKSEIRLYSAAQRQAWIAECDAPSAAALKTLLRYGLRLNELFFPPEAYIPDPDGDHLVINKRKRGALLLPLRADDGRDIAARVGRAQAAELKTIWFEERVIPALGKRPEEIVLEPLTYYGLQARLRGAAKRAGIDLPRLIHGARHHAGTVFLGKTGNLKLTQQLLGHADIKSTLRYAHAMAGALRSALEDDIVAEQPPERPAIDRSGT